MMMMMMMTILHQIEAKNLPSSMCVSSWNGLSFNIGVFLVEISNSIQLI